MISSTFMPAGSSCNCAPAPVCPQIAPCGAAAAARDTKTYLPLQQKPLDDLELRAIAIGGLDLNRQNEAILRNHHQLNILERLGEEEPPQTLQPLPQPTPAPTLPANDDLIATKTRTGVRLTRQQGVINTGSSFDIRQNPKKKSRKPTDKTFKSRDQPIIFPTTEGLEGSRTKVDHSTTVAPDVRRTKAERSSEAHETIKCNSYQLREIIINNISENSSLSKRAVNRAAEASFGGNIDVVCSRGHFSYVYSSNLFCEASKGDVTCIAYRQS